MTQETLPEVGFLEMEVGGGTRRRNNVTRLTMRCDALGCHDQEVLLLSVAGPERTINALTASLHANNIFPELSVTLNRSDGDVYSRHGLGKSACGYKVYKSKLVFNHWHIVAMAKKPGFMSVLTEETLWRELQSARFTTPLLREWLPWLAQALKERGQLVELEGFGCQAGVLQVSDEQLGELVSEGIRDGSLPINGRTCHDLSAPAFPEDIRTLDDYMLAYGQSLGRQAERSMNPLHVPGRDPVPDLGLLREPFEAQAHVIQAVAKVLDRQKTALIVAEMGCGKCVISMAAIHARAKGKPYRALVFCPGTLVQKWEREIRETIPGAAVIQIENWKTLLYLDRTSKPAGPEWYIIARNRAKLGSRWQPAFLQRQGEHHLRCPGCGHRLVTDSTEPLSRDDLTRKRSRCEHVLNSNNVLEPGCNTQLWQMTGKPWRYTPALYIKRRLKHFFDYLVLDEMQEEKVNHSAQGHAAGSLATACRKVIAMTGTLIGGKAEDIRPLLFRLAPRSLAQENLSWSDATAFNELYGRIETRITTRSGGDGDDNRMSNGSSRSVTKSVQPGIMPSLFGRHLLDKAVFLSLNDVADNLPPLNEDPENGAGPIAVPMDGETRAAYVEVEKKLREALRQMLLRGDRRLLGPLVQTLLAYPDYPYDWEPVGYWEHGADDENRRSSKGRGTFITVVRPPSLRKDKLRPKEKVLLDLCKQEQAQGRKVWVYCIFTDKHDVQGRLERILSKAGLKVGVLRSSVEPARREAWIARHAPQLDVVISHPKLVETGLDLFDKAGKYNFPTIVFETTGYNLFTLRQAARRSWRIGQREPCRVVYLYYQDTMQTRAMALMGKKLIAAQALEGKFSSEGLVALAGEDAGMEMALARSLVDRMDEGDARRLWNRVAAPCPVPNESLAVLEPIEVSESLPLTGEEIKGLMKRARLTCAILAERLGVTGGAVRKARKCGVPGAERGQWLDAIGPEPEIMPLSKPRRARKVAKAVLKACGAAALFLLSLLVGNQNNLR